MKRRLLILTVIAAAAVLAYGVSHWCVMRRAPETPAASAEPLVWMQEEFQLDAATLDRVKSLHESYQPTCGDMCLAIAEANTRVRTLTQQSRVVTPELAEAVREAHLRQADCRTAMLRHIYETAALLPPEAGRRYLSIVTARLLEDGLCISEVVEQHP